MKRSLQDDTQERRLPPPRDLLDLYSLPQDWPSNQYWGSPITQNSNANGASLWSQTSVYDNSSSYTLPSTQSMSFETGQPPFGWNLVAGLDLMNPSFDSTNSQSTPDSSLLPGLHSTEPSQSPSQTPQSSLFVEEDAPVSLSNDFVCYGEVSNCKDARKSITNNVASGHRHEADWGHERYSPQIKQLPPFSQDSSETHGSMS